MMHVGQPQDSPCDHSIGKEYPEMVLTLLIKLRA